MWYNYTSRMHSSDRGRTQSALAKPAPPRRFGSVMVASALMIAAIAAAAPAPAPAPPAMVPAATAWHYRGSGTLRWFGFRIYDAMLWSEQRSAAIDTTQHFALMLTYHRNISSTRLVDTTLEEMQRLGSADSEQQQGWLAQLQQSFPDVRTGDAIVGLNHPDVGVSFYHNGEMTATIADPTFAAAFFAIWFDPRSREPELQAALMGGAGGDT